MTLSRVHHGFYRKAHARLQGDPGSGFAVVQDLRLLVEFATDPMAAVLTHHRVVARFDKTLNAVPDISQLSSVADLLDSSKHGLASDVDQAARQNGTFPDEEHLAGIAVEAIFDHGYVDVYDIALFQPFVAGDTVTNRPMAAKAATRKSFCIIRSSLIFVTGFVLIVVFKRGTMRKAGQDQRMQLCHWN